MQTIQSRLHRDVFNPLNAELNPICYLLALLGAHHFLHVSRIMVKSVAARLLRSWVRIPPGAWIFVCCECRVLSGRGLCDELITRPEESYRRCCVVVCDVETSRMGAPYIYDISRLRVNVSGPYAVLVVITTILTVIAALCSLLLQYGSDEFGQDSPRYTSPKTASLYGESYYIGE